MCASHDPRSAPPRVRPDERAEPALDTALPAQVFGTRETSVEDALLASARQVFLRHMTATRTPTPPGIAVAEAPTTAAPPEVVTVDEIRACMDEIANLGELESPDLLGGLQHERIWILMHMARHGTGLCRQRATQELRSTLRQVSESPDSHGELLATLADRLTEVSNEAGGAAIFCALLQEVRHAIARAARPDENNT